MEISNKVYNTRPLDTRQQKEEACYDLLESLDLPYERLDHEAAATIKDCHDVDKILNIKICKNLFLCNRQKTNFYLLLMPGEKEFRTKDLSAQLGVSRLSFADGEFMEKYLNITPGSVSILGLMNDKENNVKLVIDADLLNEEFFGCHPCVNTASLKMKTSDVIHRLIPALGHEPVFVKL